MGLFSRKKKKEQQLPPNNLPPLGSSGATTLDSLPPIEEELGAPLENPPMPPSVPNQQEPATTTPPEKQIPFEHKHLHGSFSMDVPSQSKGPESPKFYEDKEIADIEIQQKQKETSQSQTKPKKGPEEEPRVVIKKEHKKPEQPKIEDISFEDLPSFMDEESFNVDAKYEPSEKKISHKIDVRTIDADEIFVDKSAYAKMLKQFKSEYTSFSQHITASKAKDFEDAKLEKLYTKANVTFARMQRNCLEIEGAVTQED